MTGQAAEVPVDGQNVACAFPLFVKVAGQNWAVGVPVAQLSKPEVDLYAFAYSKDGDAKLLSPAPDRGFAELQAKLSKVPKGQ